MRERKAWVEAHGFVQMITRAFIDAFGMLAQQRHRRNEMLQASRLAAHDDEHHRQADALRARLEAVERETFWFRGRVGRLPSRLDPASSDKTHRPSKLRHDFSIAKSWLPIKG